MARFARALLIPDRHPVLSAASLAEMTRYQAGDPPDVRALGWRLDAGEWGSWPAGTYWHTGFTGTSILVCPEADLAVVLLLGGVHPVRRLEFVRQLRQDVHRELAQSPSMSPGEKTDAAPAAPTRREARAADHRAGLLGLELADPGSLVCKTSSSR